MSNGSILYVIYFDSNDYKFHPLFPSEVITGPALTILKYLPRNIQQVRNGEDYFMLSSTFELRSNYRLILCSGYPGGFEESTINDGLKIILWEKEELLPTDFLEKFGPLTIVQDVHPSRLRSNEESISRVISQGIEKVVIEKFSKDDPIRKLFLKKQKKLKNRKEINFNPLINNYMTIRQAIGPYSPKVVSMLGEKIKHRPNAILETVREIDTFHLASRDHHREGVKDNKDAYLCHYPYPTLLLVFPWINSLLMTFKNIREVSDKLNISYDEAFLMTKTMLIEQNNEDYTFQVAENLSSRIKEEKHFKAVTSGQTISRFRVQANDNLSFLHSSFQFSPVYRLPLTGSSVDSDLAWFSPKQINKRSSDKGHFNKLRQLGMTLSNRMDDGLKNYLIDRHGPICVLSDLPMEWTLIEDVPLFYSHDVCRLPETSHESNLSEYVKHIMIDYNMSEDILKKTLVVCTNPSDPNIKHMFEIIKNHVSSKNSEVVFRYATSIKELSEMVQEFEPELLIIDTHGSTRELHLDSYLVVEGEKLTGTEIVKHKISAPLVILSSCLTAPTYGYVSPIAHAFFEAGALSVLSSVLPLSMVGANILYSRVLINLIIAAKSDIHDNWAGFISHNLRTSLFEDYRFFINNKLKGEDWIDEEKYEKRVDWQTHSLMFHTRRDSYLELHKIILEITKPELKEKVSNILSSLDDFTPDAFAYTLFGRADLIKMPQRLKKNTFYQK